MWEQRRSQDGRGLAGSRSRLPRDLNRVLEAGGFAELPPNPSRAHLLWLRVRPLPLRILAALFTAGHVRLLAVGPLLPLLGATLLGLALAIGLAVLFAWDELDRYRRWRRLDREYDRARRAHPSNLVHLPDSNVVRLDRKASAREGSRP
jgi:hypothetical protein